MQSTPAALMHRAFGRFLDDAAKIPLDMISCDFVHSLIQSLSPSFRNTQTKAAVRSRQRSLGSSSGGSIRGHESSRASVFRRLLLKYLITLFPSLDLDTLEPAQPDKVTNPKHICQCVSDLMWNIFHFSQSTCMNDGSYCVLDFQGVVMFHILILEVKEDTGTGGGNAAMEIGAHFGRIIEQHCDKPWVKYTCCPAFGLELIGNTFR